MASAAVAIKNVNAFVSTSTAIKNSEVHRIFVANLTNELRSNGFQDAFAEAFFDVLHVSQTPLTDKSPIYQQFLKIAKDNPDLQVAIQDRRRIFGCCHQNIPFLLSHLDN